MWSWITPLNRWWRGEKTRLRTLTSGVALLLPVAGAVGAVGLMLLVGRRNNSRLLLALFAIWVASPFVGLAWASLASKRWSILTRATLHAVMLILTVGSLGIYGNMISAPAGSKLAVPFLVVPLGSWLLIMIVTPMAALLSRRLSRFRVVRWLIKAVAAVVMLGVVGITVFLGLLLLDHNRDTTLPTPTGPFAVGRTTYAWSDSAHEDPMAPQPGTKREPLGLDLVSRSGSSPVTDFRRLPTRSMADSDGGWRAAHALHPRFVAGPCP